MAELAGIGTGVANGIVHHFTARQFQNQGDRPLPGHIQLHLVHPPLIPGRGLRAHPLRSPGPPHRRRFKQRRLQHQRLGTLMDLRLFPPHDPRHGHGLISSGDDQPLGS